MTDRFNSVSGPESEDARGRANEWPRSGKVFVAANPWRLAAQAQAEGFETERFRESDLVPEGLVYVIDLDELGLPLHDPFIGDGS